MTGVLQIQNLPFLIGKGFLSYRGYKHSWTFRGMQGECEELIPFFSMEFADHSSKNNRRVWLRLVVDNPMGLGYTNNYHIVVYLNLCYFQKMRILQEGVDCGFFQKKAELPKDENWTIQLFGGDREGSDNIKK